MAKPVAGEWVDEEFSGLASAGLAQVISLMEAREAQAVGLGDEQALCAKHGLRFVSYPIVGRGLPTDASALRALSGNCMKRSLVG